MNRLLVITLVNLGLVSIGLVSPHAQAQLCKADLITPSNHSQQFSINRTKGTVIDALTGLEWSICSVGQTWQNNNCTNNPTNFKTYSEALASASSNTFGSDFRLPNIKELGSIVERSCTMPAIDLAIFPGTFNAIYYSSTPDQHTNGHINPLLGVKIIDFSNGSEFIPNVNTFKYVRLVRTTPPEPLIP